jgi:hypothetical protein
MARCERSNPSMNLGVNNAEVALEINAFESPKSHDEPKM